MTRASSYLWVRFMSGSLTKDLLFRIRSEADLARTTLPGAKVFSNPADTQGDGVSDAAESL